MKRCPLCFVNYKTLSFEHIPPQSLGNNKRLYVVNENTYNPNSSFYKRKMCYNKGFGYQELCANCNNYLGSKYVSDFTKFINDFKKINSSVQQIYKINLKPLNVIKSIYANSIVINHSSQNIPENFRNYILNEIYSHQFLNYRVFISYTESEIYRFEGWRIEIDFPGKPIEIIASIQFPKIKIYIINSENVSSKRGIEITNFNNSKFNEEKEIKIHFSNQ